MRRILTLLVVGAVLGCSQVSNPVTKDSTEPDVLADGRTSDLQPELIVDVVPVDKVEQVGDADAVAPDLGPDVPDVGPDIPEVVEFVGCGDGVCGPTEDCTLCPQDCGVCPETCGNGTCGGDETCTSCVLDCGACQSECGNDVCEAGEGCKECAADCGVCPAGCGDDECDLLTEGCSSCPEDCGACPEKCGDTVCGVGETCESCPGDCGTCAPYCGDGTVNSPEEECDDGAHEPGDGCDADCQSELVIGPGVVLITEIMKNPSMVDDTLGEWLELHNTTAFPITLNGWTIKDAGNDLHVITSANPLILPGNGFLVLGRNGQPGVNGGLSMAYVYSNLNFSNKDDEIMLLSADGQEIDRVAYDDGGSFPDTVGTSLSLDPLRFDVESNDMGPNWCDGADPYGLGDFGSPGMMNPACPVPVGCPNAICDLGENCLGCPEDCGECPMICGDGLCVPGEGCVQCPTDCGVCPIYCGDSSCNGTETCVTCPQDCGYCCGNHSCDNGETCKTCPGDCGVCCGDGVCSVGHQEDCASCSNDCGVCSSCGNGNCDLGEDCGSCSKDCGACGVCGDAECTPDESCSQCPGDCGFCPPTGWCSPYGLSGSSVSCFIRLAAEDSVSPRATGLQFDLKFDTAKLELTKLVDSYCVGSSCVPWEIPPQSTLQPSGHTVASEPMAGVGQRIMLYHGADPTKELSAAYLSDYYVIGDPLIVEVRFKLKTNISMLYPSEVTVVEARGTDSGSNLLKVVQTTDGLLVTSAQGFPLCGNGDCQANESCLTCPLDCGCPVACGDAVCLGSETCSSCPTDCGECPAVCGDSKCEAGKGETCKNCASDCGVCPPECGDMLCNGTETCSTCPGDCGECPPVCGDAKCNGTETCSTCPSDCGICPAVCENGLCEPQESCLVCPEDCGACVEPCGDGTCSFGETCQTCPEDCDYCPCGNSVCSLSENCATCPIDCGICPGCPDGLCNGVETCGSCPQDCGVCKCGNGVCASDESCSTCPADCGPCPSCGDGSCNGTEDCDSCPGDCGLCPCGNGLCSLEETCTTCPMDCGPCPECGDGTCNGLEGCDTCPGDCGGCPPTGWCQIYGNAGTLFLCNISVAASSSTGSPATGLQFVVKFLQTKVNLLGFVDQFCTGDVCVDWEIPPQSSLQPSGHSLVFDDVVAGQKKVLIYHGSQPESSLSTAYRQSGAVVGDPVVVQLKFRILSDIATTAPVNVTLETMRATNKDAHPLNVIMSDGVLITSDL